MKIYWSYNDICSNVILLKNDCLTANLAKYALKHTESGLVSKLKLQII